MLKFFSRRDLAILGLAGLFASSSVSASHPQWDIPWLEPDTLHLKSGQVKQVGASIHALEKMEFDLTSKGPLQDEFVQFFGGGRSADVLDFLRERIHFVGADLEEGADETYASNYGPSWLEYIYHHRFLGERQIKPQQPAFKHGTIPITSPRTGLIVLGGAYSAAGTSDFDRLETLIHEARHSDCPVMPEQGDLENFVKGRYLQMTEAGRSCTHVHVPCPRGHALSGQLACDAHPWGAYMAGYLFAESVFKSCRSCSETQRQEALATAKENFTRLRQVLQRGLNEGTLPAPEMGSLP
jgi:hypothetical protein